MNAFRLIGDLSHLVAIVILLVKICASRSCAGLSGKSQLMFALVFTTRYPDLFIYFVSFYNSIMKVLFTSLSYATVFSMYYCFKKTRTTEDSLCRLTYFVIPIGGLTFLVSQRYEIIELFWTFSICLEAVAILPQLILVHGSAKTDRITAIYLSLLGSYRALYLLNWVYRYYTEGFVDQVSLAAGCVQTLMYVDFICLYIFRKYICRNRKGVDEKSSLGNAHGDLEYGTEVTSFKDNILSGDCVKQVPTLTQEGELMCVTDKVVHLDGFISSGGWTEIVVRIPEAGILESKFRRGCDLFKSLSKSETDLHKGRTLSSLFKDPCLSTSVFITNDRLRSIGNGLHVPHRRLLHRTPGAKNEFGRRRRFPWSGVMKSLAVRISKVGRSRNRTRQ